MMGCVRFIGHAMVFSFRFPPFADFFQNAIGRIMVFFCIRCWSFWPWHGVFFVFVADFPPIFHSIHSILFIPFYSFHCIHSIVFIPLYSFHSIHSILPIPFYSFHSIHSILFIPF